MYDGRGKGRAEEGQSGPESGSKFFTKEGTLNESAVGKQYFRVAAAFRGNRQLGPPSHSLRLTHQSDSAA